MAGLRGAMGALVYPNGSAGTNSAMLALGVDGGGTKTEATLVDLAGNVLGRGIAGTSNYQKVGFIAAATEIKLAIEYALHEAQAMPGEVGAIALGMAGVDRAEDVLVYEGWAREHFPQARVVVVNDAELVLPAGTPDGWGIGVICGTGATVVGRTLQGAQARADGWGHLLGDAGSGYWIGITALRAIFRAADGRGPATLLQPAVLETWQLPSFEAIMTRVYSQDAPPSEIAALAKVVNHCAETGDEIASSIIARAGAAIAESVAAVVQRLDLTGAIPIGLAGGVIVKSTGVQSSMLAAAAERGLDLTPVTPVDRPVLGAIRLATNALRSR